ncbi:MAG: hypothetical protein QXT97_02510 [Candidatus Diapherotrites archaeon]
MNPRIRTTTNEIINLPATLLVTEGLGEMVDYSLDRAPFSTVTTILYPESKRGRKIVLSGDVVFNSDSAASSFINNLKSLQLLVTHFINVDDTEIPVGSFNFEVTPILLTRKLRVKIAFDVIE